MSEKCEILPFKFDECGTRNIVDDNRLSTINNADNIYVLEKGTIVEHGNYNDLVNQSWLYRNLYKLQFTKNV